MTEADTRRPHHTVTIRQRWKAWVHLVGALVVALAALTFAPSATQVAHADDGSTFEQHLIASCPAAHGTLGTWWHGKSCTMVPIAIDGSPYDPNGATPPTAAQSPDSVVVRYTPDRKLPGSEKQNCTGSVISNGYSATDSLSTSSTFSWSLSVGVSAGYALFALATVTYSYGWSYTDETGFSESRSVTADLPQYSVGWMTARTQEKVFTGFWKVTLEDTVADPRDNGKPKKVFYVPVTYTVPVKNSAIVTTQSRPLTPSELDKCNTFQVSRLINRGTTEASQRTMCVTFAGMTTASECSSTDDATNKAQQTAFLPISVASFVTSTVFMLPNIKTDSCLAAPTNGISQPLVASVCDARNSNQLWAWNAVANTSFYQLYNVGTTLCARASDLRGARLSDLRQVTCDSNDLLQQFASTATPFSLRPVASGASPTAFHAVQGTPYSFRITASGTPLPTLTVLGSTVLNSSVTVDGHDLILSGNSPIAGQQSMTIRADNGFDAREYEVSLSIDGSGATYAITGNPNDGQVQTAYSYQLNSSQSPASIFVSSGRLPDGLSMTSSGLIQGTPIVPGRFDFTVLSTGSWGLYTKALSITINDVHVQPYFVTSGLSGGRVGSPYSGSIVALGSAPTVLTVTGGALPPGVSTSLSPLNGNVRSLLLDGTPTTAGTYVFTISASNGGIAVTRDYSIIVAGAAGAATVPVLTSSVLPKALVGSAYNTQFVATGSPAPTFSMSGTLPAGLTFNGVTGVLSGTPTASFTGSVSVTATNTAGSSAAVTFGLEVDQSPVFTTSATLAGGQVGVVSSQRIVSTGFPTATYSITQGQLPPGLTLGAADVDSSSTVTAKLLSGTPSKAGSWSFTLQAAVGAGTDVSTRFTMVIAATAPVPVAPTVTTVTLAKGLVGSSYSAQVVATGSPAPTFSASGPLPDGLTFNTLTGVLSGVPTAAFSDTIVVTASNGSGPNAVRSFDLDIGLFPAFTTTSLPGGTSGAAYSALIASTGFPTVGYSVTSGTLPPGLSLGVDDTDHVWNTTTKVLSGTPTAAGTYTFQLTGALWPGAQVTKSFTIVIAQATMAPVFTTSTTLAGGQVGVVSSQQIISTGFPTATYSITQGQLPPGLTLAETDVDASSTVTAKVLSGTPTQAGTWSFTLKASVGAGADASAGFTMVVAAVATPSLAPTIAPATLTKGLVGQSYSFQLVATGSPAPTFSVNKALPAGLTLDSASGLISGVPAASFGTTLTFTATNAAGSASMEAKLDVWITPTFVTTSLPNTVINSSYVQSIVTTTLPVARYTVTGTLPPGLTLNETDTDSGWNVVAKTLSGTPTTAGTYTFAVAASIGLGPDTTQGYTIIVAGAAQAACGASGGPLTLNCIALSNGHVGQQYAFSVSASGATGPVTFGIVGGALPAGMALAANGMISGVPTKLGTYSFLIAATSGGVVSPSVAFSLTITA